MGKHTDQRSGFFLHNGEMVLRENGTLRIPADFLKSARSQQGLNLFQSPLLDLVFDPNNKRICVINPQIYREKLEEIGEEFRDASFSVREVQVSPQGKINISRDGIEALGLTERFNDPDNPDRPSVKFLGAGHFFEIVSMDQWKEIQGQRAKKRDKAVLDAFPLETTVR